MTDKQPLISIIVPVYRVEAYLSRCVDSILSQTYPHLEILLVDDGSPDNCGAICDDYAARDKRVKALHKPNGGLSDARNFGAAHCTGDYALFVDSDDAMETDMVATLWDLIDRYGSDIACCGMSDHYQDRVTHQFNGLEEGCVDGQTAFDYILQGKRISGSICSKLLPRRLFEQLQFTVGRTYEDAMYLADLMPLVQKAAYTTAPKYRYYHRSESITTSPFKPRDLDVIVAYDKTAAVVEQFFPALRPVAEFRCMWAHFVVMDRMLHSEQYASFEEFSPVKQYLKKHALKAAACRYFSKGRRMAALVLKLSLPLYRRLMLRTQKQIQD